MKLTAHNNDAEPWGFWREVKQRATNVKSLLFFAWLAIWYDSHLFAAVFMNISRQEGDAIIQGLTYKNGKGQDVKIKVPNH